MKPISWLFRPVGLIDDLVPKVKSCIYLILTARKNIFCFWIVVIPTFDIGKIGKKKSELKKVKHLVTFLPIEFYKFSYFLPTKVGERGIGIENNLLSLLSQSFKGSKTLLSSTCNFHESYFQLRCVQIYLLA